MASTQLKPDRRQGFDYTYDKRLYDRPCDGHARPVRDHFLDVPLWGYYLFCVDTL